jgi:uncharacterized protein (TIGR00369 family)
MSPLNELMDDARKSGDYGPLVASIPYLRFLGALAHVVEGKVRVHLPYQPLLVGNIRLPSLHGGVAGACLETAALLQLIHDKGSLPMPKTIDFTVDYLRAAGPSDLFADADVQRVGRRVANVRMRAWQADPAQPVVLGRGNFLLD